MRIAIDASHINRDGAGIGYVIKGMIEGFAQFTEHDYLLITRSPVDLALPDNFQSVIRPSTPRYLGGGVIWYYRLAQYLKRSKVDVLVMPTMSVASLFFPKVLQIINDLTPLSNRNYFGRLEKIRFGFFLRIVMWKAWKIFAISRFTRADLLKRFPKYKKDIVVIPLGLNNWVGYMPTAVERGEVRLKYDLPEKYFLSISTIQPRKNYANMIEAFAKFLRMYPEYEYVIGGGKGWNYTSILQLVSKLKLENKVRFLGYVPETDLPSLYDQATALMFASFEEGYGLPIIEARARSLAVLTSNIPVFHEVADPSYTVFVNPDDINDIGAGLRKVINIKAKLPAPEFFAEHNWRNTAHVLLSLAMH